MAIQYTCENCGSNLKIKDELTGTKGKCPKCKHPFTVPFLTSDESIADFLSTSTDEAATVQRTHNPSAAATTVDDVEETLLPEPDEAFYKNEPQSDQHFVSAGAIASNLLSTTDQKAQRFDRYKGDPRTKKSTDYFEIVKYFAVQITIPIVCVMLIVVLATVIFYISKYAVATKVERPELGQVTGVVTYDNFPLISATVMFIPETQIGPDRKRKTWAESVGKTDKSGRYSLKYVQGVEGAAVGKHRVEIQAVRSKILLPPKYNTQSRLVRKVKLGDNVIDFRLESK